MSKVEIQETNVALPKELLEKAKEVVYSIKLEKVDKYNGSGDWIGYSYIKCPTIVVKI